MGRHEKGICVRAAKRSESSTPCTNTLFAICLAGKYSLENLRKYLSEANTFLRSCANICLEANTFLRSCANICLQANTFLRTCANICLAGKYSLENLSKYLSGSKYFLEKLRKYFFAGNTFLRSCANICLQANTLLRTCANICLAGKYSLEKLRKYLSGGKTAVGQIHATIICICYGYCTGCEMFTAESMTFAPGRWRRSRWYCLVYILAVYTTDKWHLVRGRGCTSVLVGRDKFTYDRIRMHPGLIFFVATTRCDG